MGWRSAGLASRGAAEAGSCSGEHLALVQLCSRASSSNSTSLASSSPFPTALAVLSIFWEPLCSRQDAWWDAGDWWGIGGSSALWRSCQSLRPPGLLGGVGGWVSLPLVSPGDACPALVCTLSLKGASAEAGLSLHLLHRSHLPPAKIPVFASAATGMGAGGVGGSSLFLAARLCFVVGFGWEIRDG